MHAYNEWIAEFSAAAPDRLIGLGFVPVHDGKAAAAELYACADLGLKGVQFLVFDAYKKIWDETWEPLWAAANETGIVVHAHVSGGTWSHPETEDPLAHPALGPHVPPDRGVYASWLACVPHQLDELVTSLIFSGSADAESEASVRHCRVLHRVDSLLAGTHGSKVRGTPHERYFESDREPFATMQQIST